jgi:hypothetical protein
MKKFTILTLAIAMVAISVSAADDAKPKRPKLTIPAELLKKYDKNNDGKINKDDSLSKEDMAAYRAEMKKAREAAAGGKEAPAPAPAPAPAK